MNALDVIAKDAAMRVYAQTHDELAELAQSTHIEGLSQEASAVAGLLLRAYAAEMRDPAPIEAPIHACTACIRYVARVNP